MFFKIVAQFFNLCQVLVIYKISKTEAATRGVLCKKVFLGKHLCQSLFFNNKVAGLRPETLLKRDCGTGVYL